MSEPQEFGADVAVSNYPRVSEALSVAHGPAPSMLAQAWKLLGPNSLRWVTGMFTSIPLATLSACLAGSAIYYFIAQPILQSGDALIYSFGAQITMFLYFLATLGAIAGFKTFLVPQHFRAIRFIRNRVLSKSGALTFHGSFLSVLATTFAVTFMVGIGLLLGLIPGIYFLGKFGLAPLIAADQQLCPSKALALAAEKSQRNIWAAGLALALSSIVGVLGIAGAVIGGLYSSANNSLTLALLYRAAFPELFPVERIKLHDSVAITDALPAAQPTKKRWLSNRERQT